MTGQPRARSDSTGRTARRARRSMLPLTAALALAMASTPAVAQETDGRWLAWMGCWEEVGEVTADDTGALLCFRPVAGDVGVEMASVEASEIVARQTVRADGREYDTPLEGCEGRESHAFSSRSGRVFVASDHACEGGIRRSTSGMMAMVSGYEWIDVRVVTVGDQSTTWVTRYELANATDTEAAGFADAAEGREMAVRTARSAGAARPTVDDLIEATDRVHPEAVQAWLFERDAALALDSGELIRMADAGVPEEVIDAAIAVTYPEHFAVESEPDEYDRRYGGSLGAWGPSWGPWGYYDPFYGSFFYSPFRYGSRYGTRYGGYYGGPVIITVGRADRGGGRVIAGQGYRSGSSLGTPQGGRTSRSGGSAVGRSGGSSGGSVGRSTGSSGGRSTGRTARRRGGGGY